MNNKKINEIFLSKNNINTIYKDILNSNNLDSIPRDKKKIIVNSLVENMKNAAKEAFGVRQSASGSDWESDDEERMDQIGWFSR